LLPRNVYRKYTDGEQLVTQELPHVIPKWVAFNPGNWRYLAVSTENELMLWNVEQSNDLYYVTKRFVIHMIVLRACKIVLIVFLKWLSLGLAAFYNTTVVLSPLCINAG